MNDENGASMRVLWETCFRTPKQLILFPRPLRVGVREATDSQYSVQARPDAGPLYSLFVYTLSGEGVFRDAGGEKRIPAETGFLCEAADPQVVYGYPEDGTEPWKFLFLHFTGTDQLVREMEFRFGHLYRWPRETVLLRQLLAYRSHASHLIDIPNAEAASLVINLLSTLAESAGTIPSGRDRKSVV